MSAAIFVGFDGDPWLEPQRGRIETTKKLDILMAANDGDFLQDYRDAGVNQVRQQYNCAKIAGFILDLIEKGKYSPPWNQVI